ncbi:MAG: M42 family metallopeptidase [Chloroflexota bacterium]
MNPLPEINEQELVDFLTGLLNTPSPSGFTESAILYTAAALQSIEGLSYLRTRKGALLAVFPGEQALQPRALTAHVDTLGAMVKEIKSNGRLRLTRIGGIPWNAIETEGCTVFTVDGKAYRGSVLPEKASVHVYGEKVSSTPRDETSMEVRLDARTSSAEETRALGIQVGDFVAFDPRVEVQNGFIRSRFLDDKACVACIVAAFQALHRAGLRPKQTTYALISNYEEVGHGASTGFPPEVGELVVVDMAAIGEGQTSDEYHATLCVKDSGGPYDHALSTRLRRLADQYQIPYKVDIYPYYGSDGGALLRSGADLRVALIGPGVDSSHHYERTHLDALLATTRWILAYLLAD